MQAPLILALSEKMKSQIMYIEDKSGVASIEARIGKVYLSKTGKTLQYEDQRFQSLKGDGYKANYYDIETEDRYWISKPRKDGNDGLYKIKIHVDSEVRKEYWESIRDLPSLINQSSFTSASKHQASGKEVKNKRKNT